MKIHNFYAGPAILPAEVMTEAATALHDFNQTGLSILEISHRSKEFISVMDEAVSLVRELLNVPDDFAVLFLSGGASSQFFMAPMNLMDSNMKAAYTDTGTWANKAIKDAKLYGQVDVVASSKEDNYTHIPAIPQIDSTYRYLHITSNNTIYGTQYQEFPITEVPMVADMSSDIFSRPFDINAFDLVYAGAQKNMGPAGTTLVIVRKSALGKVTRPIPAMLSYTNHIEAGSMYNTPPVFPVYVSMLTLRWVKQKGGVDAMKLRNETKASLLYSEIERNSLFYSPVRVEDKSRMNVCFLLHNRDLEKAFLQKCKEAGCVGLEGHRSVGGFRASVYNAMEASSVQVLVDIMRDFERTQG
jgi:phosphoserine aminotransferase